MKKKGKNPGCAEGTLQFSSLGNTIEWPDVRGTKLGLDVVGISWVSARTQSSNELPTKKEVSSK